jgi:hypothetical protein
MRSVRVLAVLLAPAAGYLLGVALAVSSLPDVLDRWDRRRMPTQPGLHDKPQASSETVRDACGMCFQVPASNGLCGCAW